jgi:hypothetical protein
LNSRSRIRRVRARFAVKSIKSPCTSVALWPTDFRERDATHFGFERQTWAKFRGPSFYRRTSCTPDGRDISRSQSAGGGWLMPDRPNVQFGMHERNRFLEPIRAPLKVLIILTGT